MHFTQTTQFIRQSPSRPAEWCSVWNAVVSVSFLPSPERDSGGMTPALTMTSRYRGSHFTSCGESHINFSPLSVTLAGLSWEGKVIPSLSAQPTPHDHQQW